MPSTAHETLVELFRSCPALATELLRRVPGIEVPAGARLRVSSSAFADLTAREYHADLVLRLEDAAGHALLSIILEIQLNRDARKRYTWPVYLTAERARSRCPVLLMVIALSRRVARWCDRPIPLDPLGSTVHPLVIGPERIPSITDPDIARALPELAVLSAAAHGRAPDAERIVLAALAACEPLDATRATLYTDFILTRLATSLRKALEALMPFENYRPRNKLIRRYFDAGREQGLEDGREQGQRALLTQMLETRFGPLPAPEAERLRAADTEALLRWSKRILTARSLDEVFDDTP